MPDPYQQGITPDTATLLRLRNQYTNEAMSGNANLPPFNEWAAAQMQAAQPTQPMALGASAVPQTTTLGSAQPQSTHRSRLLTLARLLMGNR